MALLERNLWTSLKVRLDKLGFFYERIENSVNNGTPDTYISHGPLRIWLELKAKENFPVRLSTPVFGRDGLRPEQISWLTNATRKRERCGILAAVGKGRNRVVYYVPGSLAEEFNGLTKGEFLSKPIQITTPSAIALLSNQIYRLTLEQIEQLL